MKYSDLFTRYLFFNFNINKGALLFPICCFVLVVVTMTGCGSSDSEDPPIASVELSLNDETFISLGQEEQIDITATNTAGRPAFTGSATWTTSDPGVLMVSNTGLITGMSAGLATITATIEGVSGSLQFLVIDLTGRWVGGEEPDTVSYVITQTGTSVDGEFGSRLGFPPITDVNTGTLTGSLNFATYSHTLEVTTEDGCILQITGDHILERDGGEVILVPGPNPGALRSSNCSIFGTIDFATLRRQ